MCPANGNTATKQKTGRTPKVKKLSRSQKRAAWLAQGLCVIDGKAQIWKGESDRMCRKHVLYFRGKSQEYAAAKAQGKAVSAKAPPPKTKVRQTATKEGVVPADLVETITRQLARDIGGDAIVQLQPMPRNELFNLIHASVNKATRQVGFRPI